jgi:hypothetical protein
MDLPDLPEMAVCDCPTWAIIQARVIEDDGGWWQLVRELNSSAPALAESDYNDWMARADVDGMRVICPSCGLVSAMMLRVGEVITISVNKEDK